MRWKPVRIQKKALRLAFLELRKATKAPEWTSALPKHWRGRIVKD